MKTKTIFRTFVTGIVAAFSFVAAGATFGLDYSTPARATPALRLMNSAAANAEEPLDEGVLRQVVIPTSVAPRLDGTLQVGDELGVTLFDDRTLTLLLTEQTPTSAGVSSFLATADGYDGEIVAVVVQMDGRIQIDIQDYRVQRVYSVLSSEDRTIVREMDPHNLPIVDAPAKKIPVKNAVIDDNSDEEPTIEHGTSPNAFADNEGTPTVDILVAYDTDAATWAKSNGGISGFAETQVQKMNTAIANTGLNSYFRFKLVGVYEIGYSAGGDIGKALNTAYIDTATLNGHSWSGLRAKRDEVEADIVCVLVDNGYSYGTTGIGNSLETNSVGFAEAAYNATLIRAVNQGHTMTHEVGHNMGAGHAKEMHSSLNPGPQYKAYSSGYYFTIGSTKYHTIMAYNDDGYGNYYTSVPYFSSPNYTYNSVAVGDADHDNTRTLRETYLETSKYRGGVVSSALGTATETESYTWETSALYPWTRVTSASYDGVDSARSGSGSDSTTWMRTRVVGPATLTFYYKMYSYFGSFEVTCDGSSLFSRKNENLTSMSFTKVTANIPSGTHVVKFAYTRSLGTGWYSTDGVWVDQIVFSGGSPVTDSYTVTYKPGSYGTGSQQTATKTKDVALTLKGAIFTRTGYTQTGWSTSDGGSKAYNLSASYTANADITLYPYWTASSPTTYTVTYKPGSYGSGSQQTATKTKDVALTLKGAIFTRTGYTQTGWSTSDGGSKAYNLGASYTANAAITLYPYWTASGPANDSFSSPTTISGASGSTSGSNVGATMQTSETKPSAQSNSGASVWYKWTAPGSGTATFDTIGSGFDTVLSVYTGTSVSSLSEVASDDDSGGSNTSKLTFEAVSGTTYRIAVYGYGSNAGSFNLKWSLVVPTYTVTYKPGSYGSGSQQTATKTKDVALTLKGAIFTRTGYTQTGWSTSDGGSKSYNLSASYTANAAITLYPYWTPNTYTVTLDRQNGSGGTASVTATYGSAMPSITVPTRSGYTFGGYFTSTGGSGTQYYTASGASARSWDKTSATTLYAKWTSSSPTTYTVTYKPGANGTGSQQTATKTKDVALTLKGAIFTRTGYTQTGWSTSDGGSKAYNLSASYTANASITLYPYWTVTSTGPANDSFSSPTTISGASGAISGSSAGATMQTSEPRPSAQSNSGASVWYKWTAPSSGTVTFDTIGSGFDTVLAVYTGTALTSLSEVASDDDGGGSGNTSKLTFQATSGTTYRIAVYGYSGATGSFSLKWSFLSSIGPANDSFSSPTTISGASGAISGSSAGATMQMSEPKPSEQSDSGASVWYKWTAPSSGAFTFDTIGSSFDTVLAVYTGTALTSLSEVASDDDGGSSGYTSKLTFHATSGTTYRIAIYGYDGETGTVKLNWSLVAPTIDNGISSPTTISGGVCHVPLAIAAPWTAVKAVTMNGAVYDGNCNVMGIVQLKVGKPKTDRRTGTETARVTGYVMLMDGKKKSLKSVTVPVPSDAPIEVTTTVNGLGTLTAKVSGDGVAGSVGNYIVRTADVGGDWTKAYTSVKVGFTSGSALPAGTLTALLPFEEIGVAVSGKWSFGKAASVKIKNGAIIGIDDPAKPNLSGLKLVYTPRKGTFKGAFNLYALEGVMLKKYKVNVSGVVVNGVGYGKATCRKPVLSWSVTVE